MDELETRLRETLRGTLLEHEGTLRYDAPGGGTLHLRPWQTEPGRYSLLTDGTLHLTRAELDGLLCVLLAHVMRTRT